MCEMLAIQSDREVPIERVLTYAELLDEYGVAGFSWGLAWKSAGGELLRYRAVEGIRRDTLARRTLAGVKSTEYLVHLRRPSLMTTIAHRNAQPYLSQDRQLAFAHNGFFAQHREFQSAYQNRLEGTSDSEVGFCYYQDLVSQGENPGEALISAHQRLGGRANVGVMRRGSPILFYCGNDDNAVYAFAADGARFLTTALHSGDDYVLQTVFPQAEQAERVAVGTAREL